MELDVDLNQSDYDGRTALHLGAANSQIEVIRLLLKSPNLQLKLDKNNETALHDAIRAEFV